MYFLLTKKVGWKSSTCNDRMVSTRNVQVAGYWITEFLGNVTHVQCRQVHDDSLLISMTDTVDIGYVARETSPYWPWISGKIVHIPNEYQPIFFSQKRLIENPQQPNGSISNMANLWIVDNWI